MWSNFIWSLGWLGRRVGVHTWKMYACEKDLQEPIPEIKPPIELEIGIASSDDLRCIEDRIHGEYKKVFQDGVRMGNTCFVAKTRGQIAGFSWVSFQAVPLVFGAVAQYPRDTAHSYHSLVFPEFRGNKVFQCLAREVYIYLKSQGYRYACNLITRKNAASIRARLNVGACIETVRFTKLPWGKLKVRGKRRFELAYPNGNHSS
jgi:hypothetical protein